MAILFSDLCLLFERIARCSKASYKGKRRQETIDSSMSILRSWLSALDDPSPADGLVLYRLIFPGHDIRRRYGLKETLLAKELPIALGFAPPPELLAWDGTHSSSSNAPNYEPPKHGCFGLCLQHSIAQRTNATGHPSLDIYKLNDLLDELASQCDYSSQDVKQKFRHLRRRSRLAILADLFSPLSNPEAAYLAQIILRDISPLLYPIPSFHSDVALLEHNASSLKQLDFPSALRAWHWALPSIYMFHADLEAVFQTLEAHPDLANTPYTTEERQATLKKILCPVVGQRVEIPSAAKGRSCSSVADVVRDAGIAFAEVKYDGERMQIHIDVEAPQYITIFSKSKRNSTLDRKLTHPIILAALQLPLCSSPPPSTHLLQRILSTTAQRKGPGLKKVILEGEMVAYNEDIDDIDEFSNLPLCLDSKAHPNSADVLDSSQSRSNTSGDGSPQRHLAIVFFDVLAVNDRSLVFDSYSERRAMLESIVSPIPGYAFIAHRTRLDFRQVTQNDAREQLIRMFAKCIVNRDEGLMIKTADSMYRDCRPGHQWIKLKRDYIPGLGDTITCCIVGAAWTKERGRELRVPSDCFTTFYVGALENEMQIETGSNERPRYRVLFSVSHLPDRQSLLRANHLIRLIGGVSKDAWRGRVAANWGYDLVFPHTTTSQPSHILARPLVFELFGAGFARRRGSPYYELRFPRVSAIHETRQTLEAVTLMEMQRLAREAASWVGSEAESEVDDLWSKHSTTSGDETGGDVRDWRARQEDYWVKKLIRADKPKRRSATQRHSAGLRSSGVIDAPQKSPFEAISPSRNLQVTPARADLTSPSDSEPCLLDASFIWTALPASLATNLELSLAFRVTSLHSLLFATKYRASNNNATPCVIFVKQPIAEDIKETLAELSSTWLTRDHQTTKIWLYTFSDIQEVPLRAARLRDLPARHLSALR